MRASSWRQSASMTRDVRGDRISVRMGRMPGSSKRKKCRPCRTCNTPLQHGTDLLDDAGTPSLFLNRNLYLGKGIPISGTAHQAGTMRFGADPSLSVLDLDCKAHDMDNLYVADASFFPSIGAVNPTLTIIANALRVADKITQRLS